MNKPLSEMNRDELVAEIIKLRKPAKWVVNSYGELGVYAGGEYQFLYKGDSIVYNHKDVDLKFRPVQKREFGETCTVHDHVTDGLYTDGEGWEPLPMSKFIAHMADDLEDAISFYNLPGVCYAIVEALRDGNVAKAEHMFTQNRDKFDRQDQFWCQRLTDFFSEAQHPTAL